MKSFVASLLIAVAVASTPASAEIEGGAILGAHFFNPNNRLSRFSFDEPGTALAHTVAFGMRLAWLPWEHWAFEAELVLAPTAYLDGLSSASTEHLRAHVLFNILTGAVRPFVGVGVGLANVVATNPAWQREETDFQVHAALGVRYDIGDDWGLRLDVRVIVAPSIYLPGAAVDTELTLGLYGRFPWLIPQPPVADSDGDDISDAQDKCPTEKGTAEFSGCPAPTDGAVPAAEGATPAEGAPAAAPADAAAPAEPAAKPEGGAK